MALWRPYLDDLHLDSSKTAEEKSASGGNASLCHEPLVPASPQKNSVSYVEASERKVVMTMVEKNTEKPVENARMRRMVRSTNPDASNEVYKKQREKNNLAAKQSRHRRRMKEIDLGLQVTNLKKEIAILKAALNARICSQCK
ncbi:unnamed protein product [Diatraea saccharalis]|uniref:BZIP domain-containing protein n=1 Tax=Diatraea saccharalis TaxID=40085 RepID=A0A9N9WD76_9NEOP|nr:unnamed protein product [Diatraea saccharalis]